MSNERIVDNSNQIITDFGNKVKKHDEQFISIQSEKADYILINPTENSDITNDILEAFKKYNKVKIKKGNYLINSFTFPRNNLILEGEEGVILTLAGMKGVYSSSLENIKIKNIKFDGGGILDSNNSENGSSAIYLHNTNNIHIENVKTTNTGAWGIVITGNSTNINIEKCECNGSIRQSGIAISGGCSTFNINNNICVNNKYAGIILEPNISNGNISNNICSNNNNNGIIVVSCNNSNILIDNNIINNTVGNSITVINSSLVNISNNQINSNGRHGVYSIGCKNITFKGNLIQNINSCGFYVLYENGTNELYGMIFTNNIVINSCLTATQDHESSYFIRDCKDLIFFNNISRSSKKDYCIDNNIYYYVDILKNSESTQPSNIKPNTKPIRFVLNLSNPITFKVPFDIYVYGVNIKRRVVNKPSDSSTTNLIYIKMNDENWCKTSSDFNYENGCYAFETVNIYKQFNKDNVVKFSYAHTYNSSYVDNVEIELLYY